MFSACSFVSNFIPCYILLVLTQWNLIIGVFLQVLNVWNPTEKEKIMPVPDAHTGIISALTECIQNDMVGSASYDRCVKLWK